MLQAIRRLSGLACLMLGGALLAGAQLLPNVAPEKPRPNPQTKPKAALCTKPPANDQKSIAAFERQAASGDAAAQCGMALAYELGAGVPRDYAQAVLWWRKAAKQGNEAAQYWLGGVYHDGRLGVPQDYTQAVFWWRKVAEQGNTDAQVNLGYLYDTGLGVPQDHAQAARWFRKAAEQGNVTAQCAMWMAYQLGLGVPQDYTQMAFWLHKAVEQGDAGKVCYPASKTRKSFCVSQCDLYTKAAGVRQDAERGDAKAQYYLGGLYHDGEGVPQDYTQAAFWYRKAAEQGNTGAQVDLGLMYAQGEGVPQDYTQAAFWYRKAAEQGLAPAQIALGASYHEGRGVPQDYAEAYFWLDIAAAGKLDALDASVTEAAAKYRDKAASQLTPADLSRAQERARKWFEAHQAKPQ